MISFQRILCNPIPERQTRWWRWPWCQPELFKTCKAQCKSLPPTHQHLVLSTDWKPLLLPS